MSARCSSLVSFLLVCFAVIPHATWSSPQYPPRRCFSGWNNVAIALMDDLAQSNCQSCDPSQYLQLDTTAQKNVADVGIVLPHTESLMEPYLVTSTALLMRGHKVTLFLNKRHMDSSDIDLREVILSHVPCHAQLSVSNLLRLEFMAMDEYPCYDGTDKSARIHCAVREADDFLLNHFRITFLAYPVDVLILDAAMIAGQLAANILGIPVVGLLDPEFYDDLLVRRLVHNRPRTTWSKGFQRLIDFWEELEWVGTFAKYSRARRRLGLPIPSAIGGIWDSVTIVVTKPRQVKSRRAYVVEGPLMTPCLPCFVPSPTIEYSTYKYRAVLFLGSSDNNEQLTRDLYKAFWMTRDSLHRWSTHCKVQNCPENVTEWHDFGVAHVGASQNKFLPHFVTPFGDEDLFVSTLSYLLDDEEKIVLIVVDKKALKSHPWLTELDPSIVLVRPGSTVRELAKDIMKGIHRVSKPPKRLRTIKGIDPVLRALRRKSPRSEGPQDDDDSIRFLSLWFGLSSLVAFSVVALELYKEREPGIRDIIWRQLLARGSETEAAIQQWKTWVHLQWKKQDDTAVQALSPTLRRRRGHHKKKQS
eukprot:scaffold13961_cov176-Amphora_coffeaeformis.AAC.3